MVCLDDKIEGFEGREKLLEEGWNSQGLEDIPLRKSKRVLMPFAFREGILTGLLVLMFFIMLFLVALMYVVWSGSGGNAICLLFSFLSIIAIVILLAISSRGRWKSG